MPRSQGSITSQTSGQDFRFEIQFRNSNLGADSHRKAIDIAANGKAIFHA